MRDSFQSLFAQEVHFQHRNGFITHQAHTEDLCQGGACERMELFNLLKGEFTRVISEARMHSYTKWLQCSNLPLPKRPGWMVVLIVLLVLPSHWLCHCNGNF